MKLDTQRQPSLASSLYFKGRPFAGPVSKKQASRGGDNSSDPRPSHWSKDTQKGPGTLSARHPLFKGIGLPFSLFDKGVRNRLREHQTELANDLQSNRDKEPDAPLVRPPPTDDSDTFIDTAFRTCMASVDELAQASLDNCLASFQKLVLAVEQHKQSAVAQIDAVFDGLRDSLRRWKDGASLRLATLAVDGPHARSQQSLLQSEAQAVLDGVHSEQHLAICYDASLLEQCRLFCTVTSGENPALRKALVRGEEDLFLESVHDPFREPSADRRKQRFLEEVARQSTRVSSLRTRAGCRQRPPSSLSNKGPRLVRDTVRSQPTSVEKAALVSLKLPRGSGRGEQRAEPPRPSFPENEYQFWDGDIGQSNVYKTSGCRERRLQGQSFHSQLSHSRTTVRLRPSSRKCPSQGRLDPLGRAVPRPDAPGLGKLDFADKGLSHAQLVRTFQNLRIKGRLKTLDLSRNKIDDQCLSEVLAQLGSTAVEVVVLNDNHLSCAALDLLAEFGRLNHWVRKFELGGNHLIDWDSGETADKLKVLADMHVELQFK